MKVFGLNILTRSVFQECPTATMNYHQFEKIMILFSFYYIVEISNLLTTWIQMTKHIGFKSIRVAVKKRHTCLKWVRSLFFVLTFFFLLIICKQYTNDKLNKHCFWGFLKQKLPIFFYFGCYKWKLANHSWNAEFWYLCGYQVAHHNTT